MKWNNIIEPSRSGYLRQKELKGIYMKTIYDYEKREILKNCTHMCKADVDHYMNPDKCVIYSIDDYIANLNNCSLLENELNGISVNDYKKQLETGNAPANHDSGIYNGVPYMIEYIV